MSPSRAPRIVIVIALPFAVIVTYAATLAHEMRCALRYAWLSAAEEIEAARREWKR